MSIWTSKQFAPFVVTPAEIECDTAPKMDTPPIDGIENDSAIINELRNDDKYLFSMVLSPIALFAQQHKPKQSFIVLADLLTAFITNDLMTISFVNKQCVKLLRQVWEQVRAYSIRLCQIDCIFSNKKQKNCIFTWFFFCVDDFGPSGRYHSNGRRQLQTIRDR